MTADDITAPHSASGRRRVLIVGAGPLQVPLIERALCAGHVVVAIDGDPAAPGLALADVGISVDTSDPEAALAVAQQHAVDAAASDASDVAVPTVAFVAERMGLPGIGRDVATAFTDKLVMRTVCVAADLPCPRFAEVADVGEAAAAAQAFGWPVVVKPRRSQASKGVTLVAAPEGVGPAVAEAQRYARNGSLLVEEYVDGPEFTVEGFKGTGAHRSLAVSRKSHYAHRPMVANRLVYSRESDEYDYAELRALNDRVVAALGLPFGITHAEYRHSGDGFKLIEIAARGGGLRISSHIVPRLSGVDVQTELLACATGAGGDPTPEYQELRVALDFFDFAPGRVARVSGLEAVIARPDVLDAGLSVAPGKEILPAADDTTRHGYFVHEAVSADALERAAAEIKGTVVVDYE
ncbi:MAG: ATP-grasp domain-containing protein [Actinobacteria bacterium]|nr:MAG: ATP-grasp domain-containing protein [Actinomycetota bacterium]